MTQDEVCRELEAIRRMVDGASYRLTRLVAEANAPIAVSDWTQAISLRLAEASMMLIEMIEANRPAPKPIVMQIHTTRARSTSRRKKQ